MAYSEKKIKIFKKKSKSKNVLELHFTYYIKVSASSDGSIKSTPTSETVPLSLFTDMKLKTIGKYANVHVHLVIC